MEKIDRHKCALLIKATAAIKGRTQYELALKRKINRRHLNEYLNRHIDLLPHQIEALLEELDIKEQAILLSAPADFTYDPFQEATRAALDAVDSDAE